MKRIILIFTIAVLAFYQGAAQSSDDFRNNFLFGLKVGTNYSNVYDSQGDKFNADSKFGLAAGAFISVPLGRHLGVQPEVLFSQKGFRATGTLLGRNYDLTRTTDYIDVPLFLLIKPSSFFNIVVGPQFSFLIKEKNVFDTGVTSVEQQQEFKNDNLRKNLLSFAAGVDINIQHFTVGLRAAWDVQNNNENGTSTTPRYKNAWLQGTVGYRF